MTRTDPLEWAFRVGVTRFPDSDSMSIIPTARFVRVRRAKGGAASFSDRGLVDKLSSVNEGVPYLMLSLVSLAEAASCGTSGIGSGMVWTAEGSTGARTSPRAGSIGDWFTVISLVGAAEVGPTRLSTSSCGSGATSSAGTTADIGGEGGAINTFVGVGVRGRESSNSSSLGSYSKHLSSHDSGLQIIAENS